MLYLQFFGTMTHADTLYFVLHVWTDRCGETPYMILQRSSEIAYVKGAILKSLHQESNSFGNGAALILNFSCAPLLLAIVTSCNQLPHQNLCCCRYYIMSFKILEFSPYYYYYVSLSSNLRSKFYHSRLSCPPTFDYAYITLTVVWCGERTRAVVTGGFIN